MKYTPQNRYKILVALLTLSFALAQKNISAQQPTNEDVVVLDPFVIQGQEDGAQISQAISATRFATKINELPFVVNVLSEQLLDDLVVADFADVLQFAGNVVTGEGAGGFGGTSSTQVRLRGFPTQFNLVNGFKVDTTFLIPPTSVSRVEVVKGPASLLYGSVPPGGVVNFITARPSTKAGGSIRYTHGSWNYNRLDAKFNAPITEDLRFLLNTQVEDREYYAYLQTRKATHINPVVELDFADKKGNIVFDYTHSRQEERGVAGRYGLTQGTRVDEYGRIQNEVDQDFPQKRYNFRDAQMGPTRDIDSLFVSLRYAFNENYTLRAALRRQESDVNAINQAGTSIPAVNGPTVNPASPNYGIANGPLWDSQRNVDNATNVQVNLLAQYDFAWGKFQVLPGFDYNYQDSWFYRTRAGSVNAAGRRTGNYRSPERRSVFSDPSTWFYTPPQDAWYIPDDPSTSAYEGPGLLRDNSGNEGNSSEYYIYSAGYFFKDRLIATLGYRRSSYEATPLNTTSRFYPQDNQITEGTPESDSKGIYQAGAVYKVIPDKLHIYANVAQSFEPQFDRIKLQDPDGNYFDGDTTGDGIPDPDLSDNELVLAKPLEGEGWEAGLKGDLLGGKLSYSAAYFSLTNNNIIRNIVVDTNPSSYSIWNPNTNAATALALFQANGNTHVRLDEFQLQSGEEEAKGFELELTATLTKNWQLRATYTNLETQLVSDLSSTYAEGRTLPNSPEHMFNFYTRYQLSKGLYIGGTLDYLSDRSDAVPQQGNGGTYHEARTLLNAFAGYRFDWKKRKYSIQLNVDNLTNEYVGRDVQFGQVVPPTNVRVTVGVDF